jgi:hypothetical protein
MKQELLGLDIVHLLLQVGLSVGLMRESAHGVNLCFHEFD